MIASRYYSEQSNYMKQGSTSFLKVVVVIMGLIVVAICAFGLPRVIGTINLGGYDPILLGLYVAAIPFFVALYQAWKLLVLIDKNEAFSELSVEALKYIKRCAVIISVMFAGASPYIYMIAEIDDAPGVVLISLIIISASVVIAVFAALLQKLLRNAIDMKKENELTV